MLQHRSRSINDGLASAPLPLAQIWNLPVLELVHTCVHTL